MPRRSKRWRLYGWGSLAVPALLLLVLYGWVGQARLPTCASAEAERIVKADFNGHPLSQLFDIKILKLTKHYNAISTSDERICTATAVTNKGENEIAYTLYWAGPDKDNIKVRVEQASRELNYGTFTQSLRRRFGGN